MELENQVKVAILDSGVDYNDDVPIANRHDFVTPYTDDGSIGLEDWTGHGSAVAGIIGAQDNGIGTTGVNPNAVLYSAKILDENNQASVETVIDAINWAIEQDIQQVLPVFCNNNNMHF